MSSVAPAEAPAIEVSVVIATRNGSREILRTLSSLLAGSRTPNEIVVLDQSDDDATRTKVQEAVDLCRNGERIRYIASTRDGLCAHRNDALAAAAGEFIVCVDDDVAVPADWLQNMLYEWIERWERKPVLITGPILPAPEFEPGALISAIRTDEQRQLYQGAPRIVNTLIGAQFGASRELFESLQPFPFDERLGVGSLYPGGDDDEFAYRVMREGYPVVYEPSVRVTHHTVRVQGWRRMTYHRAVGSGATMAKHALAGDVRLYGVLFKHLATQLIKFVKSLPRLDEPRGSGRLFGAVGTVWGFLRWSGNRFTGRLQPEDYRQPGAPDPDSIKPDRGSGAPTA